MNSAFKSSKQIDIERRKFLKSAGAFTAILLTSGIHGLGNNPGEKKSKRLPLHPGLLLPGIHCYPNQESVEAGKDIRLHISSNTPYDVKICRLGNVVDDPAADIVLTTVRNQKALPQAIYPGSYVYVEKGLKGTFPQLTIEGWVRPWKTDKAQTIFSQQGLKIDLNAAAGFDIQSDGLQHATPAGLAKKDRWVHWALVSDNTKNAFYLNGKQVASRLINHPTAFTGSPITLGASINKNNLLEKFADADIASIACYAATLSPDEINKRFEAKGMHLTKGKKLLAHWDFSEEKGDSVADKSANGLNGKIINHGTWMIGGPSFAGDVERFGGYDPTKDDQRGHALRLASDDLYDCEWKPTFSYTVPADAQPGFYVARLSPTSGDKEHFYDISFIVKRSAAAKKAPILVMASTNTWRAYNSTPFALPPSTLKYNLSTEGLKENPLDPPAYSFYRMHAAGQGTYQLGLKIPWPAAGPYVLYGADYSHLLRGDRFTHLWLEKEGYNFDVITDTDLHKNPPILKDYALFIINGHSEYWSVPMYTGLEQYLKKDGKVLILSGNSLFWRVSFNEDCSVMECRKVDAPGFQVPTGRRGEAWHSHDKDKGGLLRETNYPGWKLTGLEMLGWINSGIEEQYGPYIVENPDHFLFHQPNETGLKEGDAFGLSAGGKLPGVNGHEIDVRLITLKRLQEQPGLSVFPTEPEGISTLAVGKIPWKLKRKEPMYSGESFDIYMRTLKQEHEQGADVIFWKRPEGGTVFNAGSIRSGWALWTDEKFQGVIKNVLHHFNIKPA